MVAIFYLGGLAINGDIRSSCTSSVNRARRRAASRGVGVASLGVVQPSGTSVAPARGGVSCGGPCTGDIRDKSVVEETGARHRCLNLLRGCL